MDWRSIDEAIGQGFSGAVRVTLDGKVVYQRAAGMADRANRLPNTLTTRFGIASGTKLLTALTIGGLIEDSPLTLDTPLRDCIGEPLPFDPGAVTIAHLLTHTSGLPDYFDEELFDDYDDVHFSIPWYALRGPRDYLPLFPDSVTSAPGEKFAYNNGGFILLGIVIEALTGGTFTEAVSDTVLHPAGMDRSGFFAMNRLPEETALGYIKDDQGWRTNVFNLPIIGASDGGLFSTLDDIDALWAALWGGKILSPAMVEAFAAPAARSSEERSYGHGLWIDEPPGGRVHLITGADAGVSFQSLVQRDRGLRLTVMSNSSQGAWPIVRALKEMLIK